MANITDAKLSGHSSLDDADDSHNAISIEAKKRAAEIPWNPKMHQQRGVSDWVVDIIIWVVLALVVIAVLYPMWFVVIASFSNPRLVATGQVTLWPRDITFAGYEQVFADDRIWRGYLNTIIYSVVGTAVNMIVTLPAAFALSRRDLRGRRPIMFLFTFTMYFGGGLIPNYLLFQQLHLIDNWLVYILPGAVSVWNLIIARSFFETSIPEELHDAAQIDGMGYFGYFMKIVLPLSSAIIAVLGLYYFVGHWNDYFTGLIYINNENKYPLQNVLQSILLGAQTAATGTTGSGVSAVAQQQLADQIKYGVMIVSTAPLIVLYPFLQKYFNKGVMIGAVKG
ncbi:sugar ABC transporter permease [Bifidobacterium sp. DSM 109957]|uniref:Sugar ABC transporter permease n=2 Tax=Bifidobacterium oedipodis TaxID=2675322 RepID=A0A7Y0ERE6_9BIFI|nr:sugar ABC transporter permease [Bifidobacterium sp. DSM 109957]